MADQEQHTELRDPWLIAAWPGLGGVAVVAATYLIRGLQAQRARTLPGEGFFDLHHIDVKDGIASTPRLPGGYFYEWRNPGEGPDLLIFIGEAQPQVGGGRLCREILEHAASRGVRRILSFAALGTQLHPSSDSRVHAVATDREVLSEITRHGAVPLREGQIGGLNGVLLGVGEGQGFAGVCLMAEIPYFAGGVPNPKASRAALEIFSAVTGVELDLTSLDEQAEQVDQQLLQLLERLQEQAGEGGEAEGLQLPVDPPAEDEAASEEPEEHLNYATRARLEQMFEEARKDRAKAFELKKELDRLGVFEQYEDRFLDLFKRGE